MVTRGGDVGEMGRCWSKVLSCSYKGGVSLDIYSIGMRTIVNKIVLYAGNWLRIDFRYSYHKKNGNGVRRYDH